MRVLLGDHYYLRVLKQRVEPRACIPKLASGSVKLVMKTIIIIIKQLSYLPDRFSLNVQNIYVSIFFVILYIFKIFYYSKVYGEKLIGD